jgi:hypothetical protein
MWILLRPHAVTVLISLIVGVAAAYEFRRGYSTAFLFPAIFAGAFTVERIFGGLSQEHAPLVFIQKLALAYLAFGIGFATFWVARLTS